MKHLITSSILLIGSLRMVGQQQTKTTFDITGNKQIMDRTTGLTVIEKTGKVSRMKPKEIVSFCNGLEEFPSLVEGAEGNAGREICEEWGEVQPRSQVERLSFERLISRLLILTADSTDFERYRGMQLKSDRDTKVYDATVVPDDLGDRVSCAVLESQISAKQMFHKYECSIKTSSYPEAIALQGRLVSLLAGLKLEEDPVTEHGLAVSAHNEGRCAPTGECEDAHTYVTAVKDGKRLVVKGDPIFTRPNGALTFALTGHDGMIGGVAPDSGIVKFAVYSWGPNKTGR